MGDPNPGFGVYVHWPFCAAKCPYCDFNSHVRRSVDHDAWAKALTEDISTQACDLDRKTVTSVFFGGGTPSLMDPKTVAAVLNRIATEFPMADDVEITLEANPTSIEADKFKAFKDAGINRVSMGFQALNDVDLKRLGRMHTAAEAMQAFDIARSNFARVSFDLIYARQDQTLAEWEAELTRAIDLAVDHLSLYQLTVENNTRFGELAAKNRLPGLPQASLAADMFDLTRAITADHGMLAYEVSNHARDGATCRHNLTYWRYGGYLGVGPGAHGRVKRDGMWWETTAVASPEAWLSAPDTRTNWTSLDAAERGVEMILMSLRLTEGLDVERFEAISGQRLSPDTVSTLIDDGFLIQTNSHIKATEAGFRVLNTVISHLCDDWRAL